MRLFPEYVAQDAAGDVKAGGMFGEVRQLTKCMDCLPCARAFSTHAACIMRSKSYRDSIWNAAFNEVVLQLVISL